MEIIQVGDPVLRQTARRIEPAEAATADFRRLVDAMRDTMHDAPGVGLAAPQIGLSVQLAVVEDTEITDTTERTVLPFTVLINPSIQPVGEEDVELFEGCLSVDGYRAIVARHRCIRAQWTDLDGEDHDEEFVGYPARILQHEVDHLAGVIYVDRMLTRSLATTYSWAERWADVPVADVHELLGLNQP